MRWFNLFPGLLLALAQFACVSSNSNKANAASDAAYDDEDLGDEINPGAELSFHGGVELSLMHSMKEVDRKSDDFLDAASRLYDLLIDDQNQDRARANAAIDASMEDTLKAYQALTASALQFRRDLTARDVKARLVVTTDGAYAHRYALQLLAEFHERDQARTNYRALGDMPLTAALFGDHLVTDGTYGNIPRRQRDALALLDFLRRVSSTMSELSATLRLLLASPAFLDHHPRDLSYGELIQ